MRSYQNPGAPRRPIMWQYSFPIKARTVIYSQNVARRESWSILRGHQDRFVMR